MLVFAVHSVVCTLLQGSDHVALHFKHVNSDVLLLDSKLTWHELFSDPAPQQAEARCSNDSENRTAGQMIYMMAYMGQI